MSTLKMKSLILTCVMLLTGSAWAEWVKVAESDGGTIFYIDDETIRKFGNMRLVWEIQNLPARNKAGALSNRSRSEYDCTNERYRMLSFSLHSGLMASGQNLMSIPVNLSEPWRDVPPDTSAETILKYVCAK